MKNTRGFTLIELLIASAIFAVVMVSIYSAFRTGIFGYKNIQENIEIYQSARFMLERINLDLRNAFGFSTDKARFSGSKEGMSFFSIADTFYGGQPAQDYALISYELKNGKLMRACRKDIETIPEQPDIAPQELPGNVDSFTLTYAYLDKDKKTIIWKDSWMVQQGASQDEEKQLPIAVKINLKLKNNPEDYPRIRSSWTEEFERTVFLPLGG